MKRINYKKEIKNYLIEKNKYNEHFEEKWKLFKKEAYIGTKFVRGTIKGTKYSKFAYEMYKTRIKIEEDFNPIEIKAIDKEQVLKRFEGFRKKYSNNFVDVTKEITNLTDIYDVRQLFEDYENGKINYFDFLKQIDIMEHTNLAYLISYDNVKGRKN